MSGPTSTFVNARRTEQVLLQLIEKSRHDILLIPLAPRMHDELHKALAAAPTRGFGPAPAAGHALVPLGDLRQ